MSALSDSFVLAIPFTEEEMVDVANSVIRIDSSRRNYHDTIESLQQLTQVMQEHLDRIDKKVEAYAKR